MKRSWLLKIIHGKLLKDIVKTLHTEFTLPVSGSVLLFAYLGCFFAAA